MDASLLLSEVVAIIRGTWPEIPSLQANPRQIYTSVQALRISFEQSVESGTVKTPCVVVRFGSEDHDADWGVGSDAFRVPLAIFYIAGADGKQTAIHAKLVALRDAFEAADLAGGLSFQIPPERATIDTSDDSDVNQNLTPTGQQFVSGHIEWSPGLIIDA